MTYFNALTGQYETIADGMINGANLQCVPTPANFTPPAALWFNNSQILLSTTINRTYQYVNNTESFRQAFLYHLLDRYLLGGVFYFTGKNLIQNHMISEIDKVFKGGVRLELRGAPRDLRQTGGNIHARIEYGGQVYTPFIMPNPYNRRGFYPEIVNGVWNVGNGAQWGTN